MNDLTGEEMTAAHYLAFKEKLVPAATDELLGGWCRVGGRAGRRLAGVLGHGVGSVASRCVGGEGEGS